MKIRAEKFKPSAKRWHHAARTLCARFITTRWSIKINRRRANESVTRTARAFTLLELIIVLAVLAVLANMLLPSLAINKAKAPRIKCVNNLKQVGLAFQVFAGDNNDKYPIQVLTNIAYADESRAWIHFQAMSNELQTPKVLLSPPTNHAKTP